MTTAKNKLTVEETQALFSILKTRFQKNPNRHKEIEWETVAAKLQSQPGKLWSLQQMENTGGEPDVVGHDKKTNEFIFFDCCPESPKERRSVCYDRTALDSRKEHKPADSAMEMASAMGVELLNEDQYKLLQQLGAFDTKTSSWIITPAEIRKRGGALFADRRYDHVFVYHNGAESYYAARGFRGSLHV